MKQKQPEIQKAETRTLNFEEKKEAPPIYAIMGKNQNVLDVYSLTQARQIQEKIRGDIFVMLRETEEDFVLLYPVI